MKAEQVFLAGTNLRPLWRFFLAALLIMAAYGFAGDVVKIAIQAFHLEPGPWEALFWGTLITLVAVLAAFKLLTRGFEHRPLGSVGLALHSRWWKEFGHGVAVGAGMILIVAGTEWACGFVRFTASSPPQPEAGVFTVAFLGIAAANEELAFRGYPFQRLVESLGPTGAVALMSVLFGALHLANPHHTWFSLANTALVGVVFSLAYLRTRALWMPIGMHFIWNFLMGYCLGLPVSGIMFPVSLLRADVGGRAWMTGAEYGPEGGALATVAIGIATLYLCFSRHISMTEEMRALVFAPTARREPEKPISIFTGGSGDE